MNGINWTEIKSVLEECIRGIIPAPASNPSFEPRWQYGSEANGMAEIATGWKTFLRIVSVGDISNARAYVQNESDPDRLDEEIRMQKRLVVEFRCEADFHDDDARRWAVYVVETVRTALRLRSVSEKLLEANVSLGAFTDTVDVSFEHDNRWVNAYSCDLGFNVAGCFSTAELPFGVGWFDKVLLSSCVLHEGEEEPDERINFTDKLIAAPTP